MNIGEETKHALENFGWESKYSLKDHEDYITILIDLKYLIAETNNELKVLDDKIFSSIREACIDVKRSYRDKFNINMIQGGAGTSTNMVTNEIISEVANCYLENKKCDPNDHVNMSQSTNDFYPTSIKLHLSSIIPNLLDTLDRIIGSFNDLHLKYEKDIKMGRTQLQMAVPMRIGEEFKSFAFLLKESIEDIKNSFNEMKVLNMGGTAIGNGINVPIGFIDLCIKKINDFYNNDFRKSDNMIANTSDTTSFLSASNSLNRLAVKLNKISNDLRLLSSTDFNDIELPKVQKGSSIMPGKINPVIPEYVNQICFKVMGNNHTVEMASMNGQLQLNAFEPIIHLSIIDSIDLLIDAINTLNEKCIEGIIANIDTCRNDVLSSPTLITLLNPIIGYKKGEELVKKSKEENVSIIDLLFLEDLFTDEISDKLAEFGLDIDFIHI